MHSPTVHKLPSNLHTVQMPMIHGKRDLPVRLGNSGNSEILHFIINILELLRISAILDREGPWRLKLEADQTHTEVKEIPQFST